MQTYYTISNCILEDRILPHQVATHCRVLLRCRVASVAGIDLEGQGGNYLRPAASGDFTFLHAVHCFSRELSRNCKILCPALIHIVRRSWPSLQEKVTQHVTMPL